MCLFPRLAYNKKYIANKKNKGNIPKPKDKRVLYTPIACGRCEECRKKKKREWQIRLKEEVKEDKSGIFITFTFSNQSIRRLSKIIDPKIKGYERDNKIASIAVRRFLENWRKKTGKSVKHWLITELGHQGTENIHIHGILWTNNRDLIKEKWKYGFIYIGGKDKVVGNRAINYIIKYITKIDLKHSEYTPKIYTSKGIGKGYINTDQAKLKIFNEEKTEDNYTNEKGFKMGLPIYYRNKLYTEDQREKLWIHKLNENVRYIQGIKIDMNEPNSWERYEKTLKYYQEQNKQKGYGSLEIDWDKKIYEDGIRNINHWKRVYDQGYLEKLKEDKENQKILLKKF